MRSLPALAFILACGPGGLTRAAALHPDDFAYGMPIETQEVGTAYRFTLPVEVFMKVAHEDLRDVRVFNARGEVVPYELRQAEAKSPTRPQGLPLPLFPLHGDARASLDGVRVTIHTPGAAVDLRTAGAGATRDPHVITRYIIDARKITQPLSGFQLHWADDAPQFSGSLRIESSDDLASWQIAKDDVPVIHLLTGSAELDQSLLEFPSIKARFWRLTWIGKTAPFALASVTGEIALDQPVTPQSNVTASGSRVIGKQSEISFDVGAQLPVTQVNLLLPESNSVLQVELLSRPRASEPWRSVTRGKFYRVSTSSAERANDPIRIPTDFDRFWLVRQTEPTGSIGDVKLRATWDARDVMFLASGPGPFLLSYGNASAGASSVALEPLLKGVAVVPAQTGPAYVLGGAERLRPEPRTIPWRMAALSSTLGLGVLLLAWMAYRLSREVGVRPTQ